MLSALTLEYSVARLSSGVLTTMMFCCAFVQMVSALASSFVTPAAVMTTDMIIETSVLATLRPPRGLMTILVSSFGMSIGILAAFVTEAATLLAKLALFLGLDWRVMAEDSPFSLPAMICLMRLPEADQPSASSGVMSSP